MTRNPSHTMEGRCVGYVSDFPGGLHVGLMRTKTVDPAKSGIFGKFAEVLAQWMIA